MKKSGPACLFLNCFAALSFLGTPHGLFAATKATSQPPRKLHSGGQPRLLPTKSGPGIVVCEPVTASSDTTLTHFGGGCAEWLQVAVGGQPQFGQTPLWDSLDRARVEMGRPDLMLSPRQALALAPILGVTHAAVGTLRGAEPHLTLKYQFYQLPAGTRAGDPITLSGTKAQIAAGLPQMARILVKQLHGEPAAVPAAADLVPDDLQFLGEVRWRTTPYTDLQRSQIEALSLHDPAAGILNLNRRGGGHPADFHSASETLLAQAGNNPLVWGVITKRDNWLLLTHAVQLSALAARYPGSGILAAAETYRARIAQNHAAEMLAATRLVQDAPRNPEGWLISATTTASVAGDVRQGRVYGALSSSDARYLSRLYAQAEAADKQAVQLDPHFAAGWQNLAISATFNSDAALADHALETALALSRDKADVYGWALEMYQPKWSDEPAKLDRFAHLAAADTSLTVDDVLRVSRHLKSSGYPELGTKLLADFIARKQLLLASAPENGQEHFETAVALDGAGDHIGALTEYQKAAALFPKNASIQYHLGKELSASGDLTGAETALRQAIKLDPEFPEAYYELSFVTHDYAPTKQALEAAIKINPAYGKAYASLGRLEMAQPHDTEAVQDYEAALRFGDITKDNYFALVRAMLATGQYAQVVPTGTAALNIYGKSILYLYDYVGGNLYDVMANACLHQKQWDQSRAFSQSELEYAADDPAAHENLAEAYLGLGQTAQAQAEWKMVLTFHNDAQKALAEKFLKLYP